ncbi:MAG: hypothetical protein U0270_32845 [Labilithrix sp.]
MKTDARGFVVLLLLVVGCAAESEPSVSARHRETGGDEGDPTDANGDGIPDREQAPGTIACTRNGRSYRGFAPDPLETSRAVGTLGGERDRIKPYSALKGDLNRVLSTSIVLEKAAFGEYEANADPFENHYRDNNRPGHAGEPSDVTTWYVEPASGALEVYSVVESAFAACTKYAAANPTADCKTMARAFWSRTPIPAEIAACEESAKNGPAWACTTLVTSANFLSF